MAHDRMAIAGKGAPYSRDCLLPAPSNNYKGFKNKEFKYHAAFSIQSQSIALASYRGQRIFRSNTGHFNTPGEALCPRHLQCPTSAKMIETCWVAGQQREANVIPEQQKSRLCVCKSHFLQPSRVQTLILLPKPTTSTRWEYF